MTDILAHVLSLTCQVASVVEDRLSALMNVLTISLVKVHM